PDTAQGAPHESDIGPRRRHRIQNRPAEWLDAGSTPASTKLPPGALPNLSRSSRTGGDLLAPAVLAAPWAGRHPRAGAYGRWRCTGGAPPAWPLCRGRLRPAGPTPTLAW